MLNPMNAVVIGYGGMGSRHARMMQDIPGIRVVGAYDILPERQAAIRADGLTVYDSFEQVCGDPSVDFAVIATPNHLHAGMTEAMLHAGKHVICEKPVTLNSAELQRLISVQRETGRMFTVHQNRRWDEDYLAVKKLLKDGTLGPVYNVESRVTGSRGVPHDWRRQMAFGGGMLMDWGVHLIDQMLNLVPDKVKSVLCRLSHVTGTEVDDGFLILLTFESGLTATLEASTWKFLDLPRWYVNGLQGSAVMERWHQDGTIALLKEDAPIQDAKPVVTATGITKTMAPRDDDSVQTSVFPLASSQPHSFYENALQAMRGEAEQTVKLTQVMRTMRLIETARQSSALGASLNFE